MNIVTTSNIQTMSSREITELIGKRHDHVMPDIKVMLEALGEGLPKFGGTYVNAQNGETYPCFNLPKRETLILVSGYSVVLRSRIIDRWQELEAQVATTPTIPINFVEALRLAADEAERRVAAEQALEEAKPLIQLGGKVVKIKHTLARAVRSYEGVNASAVKRDLNKVIAVLREEAFGSFIEE